MGREYLLSRRGNDDVAFIPAAATSLLLTLSALVAVPFSDAVAETVDVAVHYCCNMTLINI